VLAPSSGTLTSSATLPGTLAAFDGANGRQVTYNGHPLYTYSGDAAPGDAKGQGKLGKWFVVTPTVAVLNAAQATATPSNYYRP
jgi:hypothetical protein